MSVNRIVIGITSDDAHRIVNAVMTITDAMTTTTAMTTEGDPMTAVTDIAMTTIEHTMIMTGMTTTEMTGTNRDIHETIGGTLIEVRETIDGTTTIVAKNLLKPNRATLFPKTSQGPTHPTKDLTPRLHGSQRTVHTLPHRTTEEIPATRHRLPVSNVTNRATTLPNAQPLIAVRHRS